MNSDNLKKESSWEPIQNCISDKLDNKKLRYNEEQFKSFSTRINNYDTDFNQDIIEQYIDEFSEIPISFLPEQLKQIFLQKVENYYIGLNVILDENQKKILPFFETSFDREVIINILSKVNYPLAKMLKNNNLQHLAFKVDSKSHITFDPEFGGNDFGGGFLKNNSMFFEHEESTTQGYRDERIFSKDSIVHFYTASIGLDQNLNFLANYLIAFSYKKKSKLSTDEVNVLYRAIDNTSFNVSSVIKSKLITDLNNHIKIQSTKAAKASIMSRNMSHNIGSHVLSYLKAKTSDVANILKEDVINELIQFDKFDSQGNPLYKCKFNAKCQHIKDKGNIEKTELPFLIGIGRFFQYLQERQDFIATVASGNLLYSSPIFFKDAIYDELSWEKKLARHNVSNKEVYNVLLDNIARSESLDSKKINIYFGSFDGKNSDENEDLKRMRKIRFSSPAGINGRQAIFSIIENIIRNSAKHGYKKNGDLNIILNVHESFDYHFDDEYYKFTIHDNTKDIGIWIDAVDEEARIKNNINSEDLNNYSILKNEINGQYKNIITLKKAIDDPLIKPDGSLKEEYKGIKEIKISAAWLRNINNFEKFDGPPIVSVDEIDGNIGYTLYLLKYKYVLFVRKDEIGIENEKIHEGVYQYNLSKYRDLLNKGKQINFRFIIFEDLLFSNHEIKKESFARCFSLSNSKIEELINEVNDVVTNVYKIFLKDILEFGFPDIFIDDSNSEEIKEKQKEKRIRIKKESDFEKNREDEILNKIIYKADKNVKNYNNRIVFRTHLDQDKEYSDFLKEINDSSNKPKYFESITGHNSSDRLIRMEEHNDEWYYKIVESALTKVLIIDERIWDRIHGKEIGNLNIIELKDEMSDEEKRSYSKEYIKRQGGAVKASVVEKVESYITRNDLLGLNKFLLKYNVTISSNSKAHKIFTEGKRINIGTLIEDKHTNKFNFYNLEGAKAEVKWMNNKITFNSSYSKDEEQYDFICIHHSLLQKISNKSNKTIKEVYAELFSSKSGMNSRFPVIVHSGRSKPNSNEMPENAPFIPYSSIEHAVLDTKFTLTELLYAARP